MNKTQLIPNLTALRGLAALIVIFFHYNLFITELLSAEMTPIGRKLYLMVDLFFVLSGFIMCYVYGDLFKTGVNRNNMKQFMIARFARIYPLHLATLIFLIGLALFAMATHSLTNFTRDIFDFKAILTHILMIQAIGIYLLPNWNLPSWSISVEWWVYMVFPFIVFFFARAGRWSKWLALVLVIAGYLAIMYYIQPINFAKIWAMLSIPASVPFPGPILDIICGWAILRCLCGFVLGMLVYELFSINFAKRMLASDFIFLACWVLLLTLWHFAILSDLIAMAIISLMILGTAFNEGRVKKILGNRFWQHMGNISYSLYLIHMPLAFVFYSARGLLVNPDPLLKNPFGYNFSPSVAIWGLIVFFIACIGIASLTYFYIEKPARNYINKRFKENDTSTKTETVVGEVHCN